MRGGEKQREREREREREIERERERAYENVEDRRREKWTRIMG